MNSEFEERSKLQIDNQRIGVLSEKFRESLEESYILRSLATRFLLKYYGKKIMKWWFIPIIIYFIIQIIKG